MKRRNKRRKILFLLCFPLITAIFIIVIVERQMPTIREYARLQTIAALDGAIGDAVDIIQAQEIAPMLTISQDAAGQVQYVQLMDAEINRFNTIVGKAIPGEVEKLKTVYVEVPLGSLLGGRLLSGWGPKIRFPAAVNCTAVSNINSDTATAGINQTHLEVRLAVTATATVFFGGDVFSVSLAQTFLIGDTVIVGEIPQVYAQNHDLQRILGY